MSYDFKKEKHNISYSNYSIFKESPYTYYLMKIKKTKPDTETIQCYGLSGNVVHECLESYINDENVDYWSLFNTKWNKKNLDNLNGLNGKPLSKTLYYSLVEKGIKIINNLKKEFNVQAEERFEHELNNAIIKGFVDVICKKNNDYVELHDWKTNSSRKNFKQQMKFYAYLYYKKYNIIPKKFVWYTLKLNQKQEESFNKEELIEFENELLNFINFIKENYDKPEKWEIGHYQTPFNAYKKQIFQEQLRRSNGLIQEKPKKYINLILKNNKLYFDNDNNKLPETMFKILDNKLSYFIKGHEFSPKFQAKLWDGKKHILRKTYLPFGLFNTFKKFLDDYNKHFKTNYQINLIDFRNQKIINLKYDTKFIKSKYQLRYYQKEAINAVMNNKYQNINTPGILNVGTGGGKTLIASELIRQINSRTLFIVNRNELAEQTRNVFQNNLYNENESDNIGLILEGKQILDKQITVAGIQSIVAILKRNDHTTLKLINYLLQVNTVFWDEAQNVKDEGMYSLMMKYLINTKYFIALTGTAYRNDEHSLLMYSLVGIPIYIKTAKELENEGFLCPVKVIFNKYKTKEIDYEIEPETYNDAYSQYIIHNKIRNNIIAETCKNAIEENKKVLILTNRVKHNKIIQEYLDYYKIESRIITGSTATKKRKLWFKEFKEKNNIVLIGSMKIFNAGIDIPDLDMIINAGGGSSETDIVQSIGRVLRKSKGKEFGYYIDFIDNQIWFKKHSTQRISFLENEKHKIEIKTHL